jgi:hypothetical protein
MRASSLREATAMALGVLAYLWPWRDLCDAPIS